MKSLFALLAATLLLTSAECPAQGSGVQKHPAGADTAVQASAAPELRFGTSGEFTVMQFTDLHYNGKERQSGHVPTMLAQLIREGKPDLVVITGDLIYAAPGEQTLREICGVFAAQGIPYAITLGNHDAEQQITHAELYAVIRTLPGCVNGHYNPDGTPQGDFVIPILSADGVREEARLYLMDSNDYNADNSYMGFTRKQVAWYETQAALAARQNKRRVNSLIFFHVPLPEFSQAFDKAPLAGWRLEKECPGRDNAGMFRALVDGGEITGVFAGHDHSNNYVAQKEGIALCYGRYSGSYAEYQELVSGARMILLQAGKRGFTTWELLANGRKHRKVIFPQE